MQTVLTRRCNGGILLETLIEIRRFLRIMNAFKGNLFIFLAFVSSLFIFSACDSITVIEKDKWIGDPCTCYATVTDKNGNITKEGDVGGCQAMDLVPLPTGGQGTLKGCENVEPIEGAEQVCLR